MGADAKIRSYTIGNCNLAKAMITRDAGVGLNIPAGVLIFQIMVGKVGLAYDLSASLMSRFDDDDVSARHRAGASYWQAPVQVRFGRWVYRWLNKQWYICLGMNAEVP
ncbi:MAG: hypothetical protein HIU85_16870 [Proteobacteria bacterium]|nr:hypothetical protein [Pseudomonadota bacterium]